MTTIFKKTSSHISYFQSTIWLEGTS